MSKATYDIWVDWDLDGLIFPPLPDDDDYVTSRVLTRIALKTKRGRDQISLLSPPIAATCRYALNNESKDYSPENESGPLYGKLLPGRKGGVRASFGGSDYELFQGFLLSMDQRPEKREKSVLMEFLGPLSRLRRKTGESKISTQLYENIATSTAIGHILDAIGWPAPDRSIDTGKTTMTYWWLEDEDPWQALIDALMTEGPGACIYDKGDGKIVFESRHYRIQQTRCNTSQATFRDVSTNEPAFGPLFRYEDGVDGVINVCEMDVKVREVAGSVDTVWEYGLTLTIGVSEVKKIKAHTNDPFKEAVTPVEDVDYVVSAGGVDSVSLDRTGGQSCTMTITAGSGGATITDLQLRAKTITEVGTSIIANTIDTTTSQNRYGKRSYKWPARFDIDHLVAQDFVNAVVQEYQEPRAKVQFALVNRADSPLTQALSREISDRITLNEPQTGLDDDFWIEQISHEVREGGGYHLATIGCERIIGNQDYWRLGTSQLGTATRLGW